MPFQDAAAHIAGVVPSKSASDITNLYEVKDGKSITKNINGVKTRGYTIMGEKSIFDK